MHIVWSLLSLPYAYEHYASEKCGIDKFFKIIKKIVTIRYRKVFNKGKKLAVLAILKEEL